MAEDLEKLSRPYGTTRFCCTLPRISSWATFSRPYGTGSIFSLTVVAMLTADVSTIALAENGKFNLDRCDFQSSLRNWFPFPADQLRLAVKV
jgi:hypothetical protein